MATPEEVIVEVRSWLRTPYRLHAMVKGAGVDCGMLPYAVYRKFNLVPEFDVTLLQDDWFCHTTQEKYLLMVQRYLRKLVSGQARKNLPALPGTLALARVVRSKVFNHSGIVTCWPYVVHAVQNGGVREVDASEDPMWVLREVEIYDPWSYHGR